MTDAPLVLAWLVLAHLGADFVFQTDAMAIGKFGNGPSAWRWLATHGLVVGVVTLPLVLVYGVSGLVYVVLTALTHFAVDRVKIVLTKRGAGPVIGDEAVEGEPAEGPALDRSWTPRPAALFALDQLAHAVILFVLWALLLANATTTSVWNDLVRQVSAGFDPAVVHRFTAAAAILADIAIINIRAASLFVATLVRAPSAPVGAGNGNATAASPARIGATIGILERLIIASLVLANGFAAIGLVVAAKTVARFRQLDDREFAEYYLLGTLASVTIAIISSVVAQQLLLVI